MPSEAVADGARRSAVRLEELGRDVRRLADQALGAGAVRWRSGSADEFRRRLEEQVGRLRSAAARVDEAAAALHRHAAALEQWSRAAGRR
jgi:hypothetical protein